jgi:cytochrome c553
MNNNSRQFHEVRRPPILILLAIFAALAIRVQAPAQRALGSDVPNAGNAQVPLMQGDMKNVPANSGQQMYTAYCATCHGATGTGNGPAVPALRERPTDLTMLSARSSGEFPGIYVKNVLTLVEPQRSNGSSHMPNWCPALHALDRYSPSLVNLRIYNLIGYLKTL